MQFHTVMLVVFATFATALHGEILDMLKSAEIDALFAETAEAYTAHETPTYSIVFRVNEGRPGPYAMNSNADELWFVRRGKARLDLGPELTSAKESSPGEFVGSGIRQVRRQEIGAGDIVNLPRGTAYRVDPGKERLEHVAVRVSPREAHPLRRLGEPSPMGDVVKKARRNTTFR